MLINNKSTITSAQTVLRVSFQFIINRFNSGLNVDLLKNRSIGTRKHIQKKSRMHSIQPYVGLTVNMLMKHGNKTKAAKILNKSLRSISSTLRSSFVPPKVSIESELKTPSSSGVKNQNFHSNISVHPLKVLQIAIKNVKPLFELKKWKKGSKILLIPNCISPLKQEKTAIRWLIKSALSMYQKKKKENGIRHSFSYYLGVEILQAFKKEGDVILRKLEIHKIAELNKSKLNKFFTKL